jgi:hypothetical protein
MLGRLDTLADPVLLPAQIRSPAAQGVRKRMIDDSTRPAVAGDEPAEPGVITGEPRVDQALARLTDLGEVPDTGHVEAFEDVHKRLHGMLGELARSSELETPDGQAEQA